jgi:hypothetical protein
LILSVLLYWRFGQNWWIFFGLLLTPDLSMLPYLANPRIGSVSYNVVHSYFLPLALAAASIVAKNAGMLPYLYIWTAHIGLDRSLGYGLKYPARFADTHLGMLRSGVPQPARAARQT